MSKPQFFIASTMLLGELKSGYPVYFCFSPAKVVSKFARAISADFICDFTYLKLFSKLYSPVPSLNCAFN